MSLSEAYDALNDAMSDAEDNLILIAKGVAVSAPLELKDGGRLEFAKSDDGWGLYVVMPKQRPVAWRSAPPDQRIAAVRALGPLLEALLTAKKQREDAVWEAASAAKLFAAHTSALIPTSPTPQEPIVVPSRLSDEDARRYAIVLVHPDGREYCDAYSSVASEAEHRRAAAGRAPGLLRAEIRPGAEVFAKIGGTGFGWIPKDSAP